MELSTGGALRAIFFDAGNTLVRMNYAAIVAQLAVLGYPVPLDVVRQAEWRARVRLDDELLACPGASTESGSSRHAYLRLVLEELGLTDAATAQAMISWRDRYHIPVGIFDVVDPDAAVALTLARQAGLGTAVISNSNGTVEGSPHLAGARGAPRLCHRLLCGGRGEARCPHLPTGSGAGGARALPGGLRR